MLTIDPATRSRELICHRERFGARTSTVRGGDRDLRRRRASRHYRGNKIYAEHLELRGQSAERHASSTQQMISVKEHRGAGRAR